LIVGLDTRNLSPKVQPSQCTFETGGRRDVFDLGKVRVDNGFSLFLVESNERYHQMLFAGSKTSFLAQVIAQVSGGKQLVPLTPLYKKTMIKHISIFPRLKASLPPYGTFK